MKCGMCDSTNTELFLDLGYIPIVDNFLTKDMLNETKALYPLNVHICKDCGLSQLSYIVPANKLFNENLKPEIRIYKQPMTVTYEASINSGFFSDTYLTMSNISESDIFNIKFQRKPFMNFIWVSVLLISFGGIINFFNKKKMI